MNETNHYLLIVLLVIIFLLLLCNKKEGFTSHPVFRMYYTTWCGYSQKALPEFEALGNEVISDSGQIIKIEKVDCDNNEQLCQTARIEGYPTIRLEHDSSISDYNGARETESMLEYLKNFF
tara:strand:+ start:1066 stop:1428 length:363 start_codon:yes stop_codon:yes gene_type:complete